MDVLEADEVPLGIIEGIEIEKVNEIALSPGDIFAVISDGIFEAGNESRQMFGTDRVVEVLLARHKAAPDRILSALREAVAEFTGDTYQGTSSAQIEPCSRALYSAGDLRGLPLG